jgi:PAS domain S-box-containing protein
MRNVDPQEGMRSAQMAELHRLREQYADAERKLREAEHFVERINTAAASLVYVYDLHASRHVFMSQALARLLGRGGGEIGAAGGNILPALLHAEDRPAFALHLMRVRELGDAEVAVCEYRLRSPAGDWQWFEVRDAVFRRDPAGHVRQMVGTATVITARKTAQLSLHSAIERFQSATAAPPVALFRLDARLRYVWVYGCFAGFAAEELIGRRDRDLFERKQDAAAIDRLKRRAMRTGQGLRGQVEILSRGSLHIYDLVVGPVQSGGLVSEIVCAAIDVSERQRAQHDLPKPDARVRGE